MSRPAIKWGQVKRYCSAHGFTIKTRGGEHVIYPPPGEKEDPRSRSGVRISHLCSNKDGDELFGCYISKLRNVLSIDIDELAKC